MCIGTEFGGWTFFVKDGILTYSHNYLQTAEFTVKSNLKVPMGLHQLSFEYVQVSNTERPAENIGDVKLFIDGKPVGELKGIKTADAVLSYDGLRSSGGKKHGNTGCGRL